MKEIETHNLIIPEIHLSGNNLVYEYNEVE